MTQSTLTVTVEVVCSSATPRVFVASTVEEALKSYLFSPPKESAVLIRRAKFECDAPTVVCVTPGATGKKRFIR